MEACTVIPVRIRCEPEYADQVPRLASWKHAHPDAEVIYLGSFWQALIREGDGLTVISRITLKDLLDKLESL